jgi:hypothetical protein
MVRGSSSDIVPKKGQLFLTVAAFWLTTLPGIINNVSRQLRNLFYLGLSSFVFPSLLNIISVIVFYKGSVFSDSKALKSTVGTPDINSLVAYIYIFVTNTYFQVIGVLLATIWVSKERSCRLSDSTYPESLRSGRPFHATTVEPGRTWVSENLPPPPAHHAEGLPRIDGAVIMHLNSLPPTPVDDIPPKENIV